MNSSSTTQYRKRGYLKLDEGTQQAVEKGRSNIIVLRLGVGDDLRVSGESQACAFLMNDPYLVDAATKILLSTKKQSERHFEYFDSKLDLNQCNDGPLSLPLLPNHLGSKFWNQKWKKLVFTKVMQCEGIGRNGRDSALVYSKGEGPPWWGAVEDRIPWKDFAGPSKAPANLKGTFSDFLFACILAAYEYHNIDVETHVHNPELGQYEPFNTRMFSFHQKSVQEDSTSTMLEHEAAMQLEHFPVKVEYEDSCEESFEYEIEHESFADDSTQQLENCDVVQGMKVEENENGRKRSMPIQCNESPPSVCPNKKVCSDNDYGATSMDESSTNAKLNDSSIGDIIQSGDVLENSSSRICEFLDRISLSELKNLFTSEEVSFDILQQMTGDNLKELGVVKYGHRFKILNALKQVN